MDHPDIKLTSDQIEEVRQTLTFEAFAAYKMALLSGKRLPLWLCTSVETQQELLAQIKSAYESWVTQELQYHRDRIENDPLGRPGVRVEVRSPRD